MSSTTVGLLAALGPNAFGAAIGALIGGRLGDLFGRKRIYQYDLLVYGLGHPADRLLVQPADAPYRDLHSGRRGRRRRADLTRTDRRVLAQQGPRQAHGPQPGGLEPGPDSRICAGVRAHVVRRAREQDSFRPPVRGRDSHVGPQAWHGGVRHLDRRLGRRRDGAHVRPGSAARGGAGAGRPACREPFARPVFRADPGGDGVHRDRVPVLEPGRGDLRRLLSLHPQDPRDAEPGGQRRPVVCRLCHHAGGRRPDLHAL